MKFGDFARLCASLIAFAGTMAICGGPGARAATSGKADPSDCRAFDAGQAPMGSRTYRIPQTGDPGNLGRCDVSKMALATHGDGVFRAVYGNDDAIKPSDAIDPVIGRLRSSVRCESDKPACTLRILVFAHGGLDPQGQAVRDAETLSPAMMADGYAPVFLIWNSDFWTTYGDRLCCVTQGEADHNPFHMLFFFPARLAGDVVASAARAPENYGQQVIRFHDSVLASPLPSSRQSGPDEQSGRRNTNQYFLEPGDGRAICAALLEASCPEIDYPKLDDPTGVVLLNGLDQRIPERGFQYAVTAPVRLGTTAIAPQIGAAAWDNMVRRTRLALQDPTLSIADRTITAETMAAQSPEFAASIAGVQDPCERRTLLDDEEFKQAQARAKAQRQDPNDRFVPGGEGAFLIFFDRLACEIDNGGFKDPDAPPVGQGRPVKVELYYFGHSMGALVGNEVLYRHPEMPWRRIVYMAAATPTRDVRLMASSLLDCRKGGANPGCSSPVGSPGHLNLHFYNLMLHPLAESHDMEVHGVVPEGSLLEWIDEMFGGPKTVDDRMFGKWTNAEKTMSMFSGDVRERMTFRVFPAQVKMSDGNQTERDDFAAQCAVMTLKDGTPGPTPSRCHPIMHGEFILYSFWRDHYLCGEDRCLEREPNGG